jgi:hypothetical protein
MVFIDHCCCSMLAVPYGSMVIVVFSLSLSVIQVTSCVAHVFVCSDIGLSVTAPTIYRQCIK